MTAVFDAKAIAREFEFLQRWPAFWQRPATLTEFLGKSYLDIELRVRDAIRDELEAIVGSEVSGDRMAEHCYALITGGIGIGKTTIASIVMPWMVHWVLCLNDPQDFFGMLAGTRIAFMQMSTSEDQARDVIFGDIVARVDHSKWFQQYGKRDPTFKKTLKFDKDVWIIPGDSAETTFEGYNILGGILDEADSHKVTVNTDYAENGFNTIDNRITSRFGDRGLFIVIGQKKSATGFIARKAKELAQLPRARVRTMTIWESRGDDYYRDDAGNVKKFAYDVKRKCIVGDEQAKLVKTENIIWVPELYLPNFMTKPEKALKDLAGIPPAVGDPFISLVDKIEACPDRYIEIVNGPYWPELPPESVLTSPVDVDGHLAGWFMAHDSLKRVAHLDIAYSPDGDAAALAMGHIPYLMTVTDDEGDEEEKPFIMIDFIIRWKAPPGGELMLGDFRRMIYHLKQSLKFRLVRVTMDGFQSTDTRQQLTKRRFESDILSIDKSLLPYFDLRDAVYEDRIAFPKYIVHTQPGSADSVEIAVKELMELVDAGKKIDHPPTGSKDVADTLAGVVTTLMGDRTYRKSSVSYERIPGAPSAPKRVADSFRHPAVRDLNAARAPFPVSTSWRPQR